MFYEGGFVEVRFQANALHVLLERLGHRAVVVVRWKQLTWCGGRLYVLLHIRLFHLVFLFTAIPGSTRVTEVLKKVTQATQRIFIS